MDVLPLQAPVEAKYQQGRLTAGGQGSGFSQPLATGVTHSPRRSRCLQPLQGCDHHARLRPGVGGAAIAQVGDGGQAADHRQRAGRIQGQQGGAMEEGLVLKQHDRLGGSLPGQGPVLGAAAQAGGIGTLGHGELRPQLAQHGVIYALLRQSTISNGSRQATGKDHAEGHFQVLAGPHRGNAIAHPEDEIGHHEAPESPALLEDFVEQHWVLAAPLAIHLVVGAHQRARPGLYAGAEVGQVKLVQHPFTHLHLHQEAGAVDRVKGEMLDAGHGVALDAAGHCRPQAAEQHRIFAIGFLGPAPAGVAQQIDAHRRQPVGPKTASLAGHGHADPLLQIHVPAGTASNRSGEGSRPALEHHPPRAINKLQTG